MLKIKGVKNMKMTRLIFLLLTALLMFSGCSVSRNDLLEKDMYSVGEVVTIDLNDSDIKMDEMQKYIGVYRFNLKNWEQIESVTIEDGIFNYEFTQDGTYRLSWDKKRGTRADNIYCKLTVKK